MPESTSHIVVQVIGGVLFAIGVLIGYGMVRTRARSASWAYWPVATGTIVVSEVTVATQRLIQSTGPTKIYGTDIRYEYEADGRSFTGDTVTLGGTAETSASEGSSEALVARYPLGAKVDVYYDPADPSTSMLEPASRSGIFNMMMVALGFVVVGSLLFAAGYFQLGH